MTRFRPFSILDIGLTGLILIGAIILWYVGDFHTLHDGDTVIYSLSSLYRWTLFAWEYDHIGALLPLLASVIHRPYWNLIAISALCSFLLLAGIVLWLNLITKATLIEASVWVCLFLPLTIAKVFIFKNAAHFFTFGPALFFSALFTFALRRYFHTKGWIAGMAMFACSFLVIYLAENAIVPLAVVTAGLVWNEVRFAASARREFAVRRTAGGQMQSGPWLRAKQTANLPWNVSLIIPLLAPVTAFFLYQLIEWQIPLRSDFGLNIANIPIALPSLLKNWSDRQLTHPVLAVIGLACLLHQLLSRRKETPPFAPAGLPHPASAVRANNILLYLLTAGIALETLAIASTLWVESNNYQGHYLTDLSFLLLFALIALVIDLTRRIPSTIEHLSLLAFAATTAIGVNALTWNSFTLTNPLAALDRTIGANTPAIVKAECDILAGDYWRVWPAVLAVNDYYYRTGQTRQVAGLAFRAWPTEYLWRPRLSQPGVKLCAFAGDDPDELMGLNWVVHTYAPDITLLMVPRQHVDPITAYELKNQHLPHFSFEFDKFAPGPGWGGPESNPSGDTFQWMTSGLSTLILPLATDRDLALRFRVMPVPALDILKSLTLSVNGQPIVLTVQPDSAGAKIFSGIVSQATLASQPRYTTFTFRINRTFIPQATLPDSIDPRQLGLAFDWLRINQATTTRP